MQWLFDLDYGWELVTFLGGLVGFLLPALTLLWVLSSKKNPMSALAWCLVVLLLPLIGPLFFFVFGYQSVNRPLTRKRRHKADFLRLQATLRQETQASRELPLITGDEPERDWRNMARLARGFGAFPLSEGNAVDLYHDGAAAFAAIRKAIDQAEHHIHLEFFIYQPDVLGTEIRDQLIAKTRQGVKVRLLYDAMGSHHLGRRFLRPLLDAGVRCYPFLPLNPLRRRLQINMRNHRKILIVDGRVGFTGGLNIGDEYLGRVERFGYWRDTHLRLEGPAVAALQRIFIEDWDFAADEQLLSNAYFPALATAGEHAVQIIESGPDRETKAIREMYFAAILQARKRLWIASPYFVPDLALYDALRLAGHRGVDVRILSLFHPDKWIPLLAARYYFADVLESGVKVYQYTRGMMHSKVLVVDSEWASVGTANLDNRSMYLNFEVNCLLYAPTLVKELETAFQVDLEQAFRLELASFTNRPLATRLLENACRLMSPVL